MPGFRKGVTNTELHFIQSIKQNARQEKGKHTIKVGIIGHQAKRKTDKETLRLQSCVSFRHSLWLHRGETQREEREEEVSTHRPRP